ncbi:MAG: FAD-dependent oxidoreductase [Lachnospiraceae bacterium]|nr:FAD-dependent oxidoreductase [Lachnospiraceae bacterium]
MKNKKIVIVGGVAGGASAATRLRRLDENAQITIFERTGYVSYANCGLPYYVGGVIEDADELTLQTPDSFWERFRIDVRTKHEVMSIDTEKKTVMVCGLETGKVFEESYDKLILAPGAKAFIPNIPGIDSKNVFTLRTVEDTFRIRDYVVSASPKSAVVVGGGFIGIEVAENLRKMGVDVTIVEASNQLMNTLDYDMATLVHTKLRSKGVDIRLDSTVSSIEECKSHEEKKADNSKPADRMSSESKLSVVLRDKTRIETDMVLMAVGVTPESNLAKEAGFKLGIRDSIVVNEKMETSVADIYAVGDAVQVKNTVTGKYSLISLAGPANKQGRIVADNICGIESTFEGSLGSSVIKVFDLTVASTGITEKRADVEGIDYDKVVLSPMSHAGYYPGGHVLTMKVVYEKVTKKILGAQIIGFSGVDKRIDVIATAISAGMKADKLKELDLAYAPPFSSAKDPVNMAGFMIENVESGIVKQFYWEDINRLTGDDSVTILDARTSEEYDSGHVEGALHIPVDDLRERKEEIDKSKPLYVYCQSGLRSYIACRILAQEGYDCYNLSGGYRFYSMVKKEINLVKKSFPCGMDKE